MKYSSVDLLVQIPIKIYNCGKKFSENFFAQFYQFELAATGFNVHFSFLRRAPYGSS